MVAVWNVLRRFSFEAFIDGMDFRLFIVVSADWIAVCGTI